MVVRRFQVTKDVLGSSGCKGERRTNPGMVISQVREEGESSKPFRAVCSKGSERSDVIRVIDETLRQSGSKGRTTPPGAQWR